MKLIRNYGVKIAIERGELRRRVVEPAKGIGRALRRSLERQQHKEERRETIEQLRKQRKERK